MHISRVETPQSLTVTCLGRRQGRNGSIFCNVIPVPGQLPPSSFCPQGREAGLCMAVHWCKITEWKATVPFSRCTGATWWQFCPFGFSPLALSVGPSHCHRPCSWAGPCPCWGLGNMALGRWEPRAGPGTAKSQQVPVSRSDCCIVVCISVIATRRWVRNWSEQDFCFQCCPLSKLEKAINTKELKTPFPEATCGLPFALE